VRRILRPQKEGEIKGWKSYNDEASEISSSLKNLRVAKSTTMCSMHSRTKGIAFKTFVGTLQRENITGFQSDNIKMDLIERGCECPRHSLGSVWGPVSGCSELGDKLQDCTEVGIY
jgi:hypothetical protein